MKTNCTGVSVSRPVLFCAGKQKIKFIQLLAFKTETHLPDFFNVISKEVAHRLEAVLISEVEFKTCITPHSLHFQEHQPDEQFWKFALTGSSQNTEFKLWSCENWTCLQTVLIKPVSTQDGKPMALKAVLDLSAQYLLLSDIHRKIVYVLKLEIKDDKASLF